MELVEGLDLGGTEGVVVDLDLVDHQSTLAGTANPTPRRMPEGVDPNRKVGKRRASRKCHRL